MEESKAPPAAIPVEVMRTLLDVTENPLSIDMAASVLGLTRDTLLGVWTSACFVDFSRDNNKVLERTPDGLLLSKPREPPEPAAPSASGGKSVLGVICDILVECFSAGDATTISTDKLQEVSEMSRPALMGLVTSTGFKDALYSRGYVFNRMPDTDSTSLSLVPVHNTSITGALPSTGATEEDMILVSDLFQDQATTCVPGNFVFRGNNDFLDGMAYLSGLSIQIPLALCGGGGALSCTTADQVKAEFARRASLNFTRDIVPAFAPLWGFLRERGLRNLCESLDSRVRIAGRNARVLHPEKIVLEPETMEAMVEAAAEGKPIIVTYIGRLSSGGAGAGAGASTAPAPAPPPGYGY